MDVEIEREREREREREENNEKKVGLSFEHCYVSYVVFFHLFGAVPKYALDPCSASPTPFARQDVSVHSWSRGPCCEPCWAVVAVALGRMKIS